MTDMTTLDDIKGQLTDIVLNDTDINVLKGLEIDAPESRGPLSRGETVSLFEQIVKRRNVPPGVHLPDYAILGSKLAKVTEDFPTELITQEKYDFRWVDVKHSLPPAFICVTAESGFELAVRRMPKPPLPEARGSLAAGFVAGVLTWRNLHHGNLVPLLGADIRHSRTGQRLSPTDVWDEHAVVCTVSQYMPGGGILSYLSAQRKRQAPTSIPSLLLDVATGLQFLYSKDVTYGAFTPGDVGIDDQERARLTDRVYLLSVDNMPGKRSSLGVISPRYAAPEHMSMETHNNKAFNIKAAEIFSLATVCLAAYTVDVPFPDVYDDMIANSRFKRGVRPPRPTKEQCPFGVPSDGLWKILEKCWAPKPEDRPTLAVVMAQLRADGGTPHP